MDEREDRAGGHGGEERDGGGERGGSGRASRWEWVVAAFGAVLLLGAVSYMLHEVFTTEPTPPRLEVAVDSVGRSGAEYLVHVRVSNTGGRTAAGLHLRGELTAGAGTVETSEATIDYVPSRGQRRAGLLFSRDPARYRLRVRPTGYDLP